LEAVSLGLALSIDSLAAGIAPVLWRQHTCRLHNIIDSGAVSILGGRQLGAVISSRFRSNLSWVSGALLILLAIMKLLS